jgi:hypothetical protein
MPATQQSEIKLFYQIYTKNNSKPKHAVLLTTDNDQKFSQDVIDDLTSKEIWNEVFETQLKNKELYFNVFRDDEDIIPENAILLKNIRLLPNQGLLSLEEPIQNAISYSISWLGSFIPETVKQLAADTTSQAAQWLENQLIIPKRKAESVVLDLDTEWDETLKVNLKTPETEIYVDEEKTTEEKIFEEIDARSLTEKIVIGIWETAQYAIYHPFQTLTLALAMQMALPSTPKKTQTSFKHGYAKFFDKDQIKNSFSSAAFSTFITQTTFAYGANFMLQNGRHSTMPLVLASVTPLFSSAAAQPWTAAYSSLYYLGDLNGQTGTQILGDSSASISTLAGASICTVGDVNGDGKMDFLIGAPYMNNQVGGAYLVYGGPWLNTPTFSLANLNGTNGVKLLGVSANDRTGWSVSSAGDVNGDGKVDLLIGAYSINVAYLVYGGSWLNMPTFSLANLNGTIGVKLLGSATNAFAVSLSFAGDINGDGKSDLLIGAPRVNSNAGEAYLVYGGSWLNMPTFSLANLNGTNGVKLLGVSVGDGTGSSVSSVGDINGDGKPDLLIGAPAMNSNAGGAYLVYGGSWLNMPIFSLANLNGINGVKLLGVSAGDQTGYSVSSAGDVNGDGKADFLIGAPGGNGVTYLIYGGSWLSMPIFSLDNLDGTNGIKLLGDINVREMTGGSVSSAGDVNGDGKADLLIGTGQSSSGLGGKAYLVYGGSWLNTPSFYLPSINGVNGVKFFEFGGVITGYTVSPAGDIHGNGAIDFLIGSSTSSSSISKVSLVNGFGFTLWNNRLSLARGDKIIINPSMLNTSGNTLTNLVISPSNIQHGYFALASNPEQTITDFTQQQVNQAQIQFVHDGSSVVPAYTITITLSTNPAAVISAIPAQITFQQIPPVLVNNNLILSRAETVSLTPSQLNSTGIPAYWPLTTNFVISNLQHGHFENIAVPGQSIILFTQAAINLGQIQFIHEGSKYSPSYSVTVADPGMSSSPQLAQITFSQSPPMLLRNQLILSRAQTIVLDSNQLNSAGTPAYWPFNTTFAIGNLQHGHFENERLPGQSILVFTQWQVNNGQIKFIHDGSAIPPDYSVEVSDPGMGSNAQFAQIIFSQSPPVLLNNQLVLSRLQVIPLTYQFNSTNVPAYWPFSTTFTINNLQHGHFENITQPGQVMTSFTQSQITQIQFVHDGSGSAPRYSVTLSDPGMTLSPQLPQIIFFQNPPVLLNNRLILNRAQKILLSTQQLNSSNIPVYWPNNTSFIFGNIQHGYFENIANPGQNLNAVLQSQINLEQVRFIHDGSGSAPSYSVSVSDPGMALPPSFPEITFIQNPPLLINNQLTITQGQSIILSDLQFSSLSIPYPDLSSHILTISNLQQGHFELVTQVGQAIMKFTQQQVNQRQVKFIHDGSCNSSAYSTTLSDPGMTLDAAEAQISFSLLPRNLDSNHLTINQGATQTLESTQLSANGFSYTDAQNLQFLITNPQHIRFSSLSFLQQEISLGKIKVTHDGSTSAPSYQVSIMNCEQTYGPWSAAVTFKLAPSPQTNSAPSVTTIIDNALIGGAVSGGVGLIFFLLKFYLEYLGKKRLKSAMENDKTQDPEKAALHANVIIPVAENIFSVVKVTGIFSDTSEERMNQYKNAIIHLVEELNKAQVNIQLESMSALQQSAFLSIVARETKKQVAPDTGCCSFQTVSRFFIAHASPEDIWNKSQAIAQAVKQELKKPKSQAGEAIEADQLEVPLLSVVASPT